jgi:tellurite resistance protein TehA-like permease
MFLINSLIFSLKIHKIPEVSLYACYVYAVLAGIFFLIVYVSFFFLGQAYSKKKTSTTRQS